MIIRTYECLDCKEFFEVDHESGDEPEPPCPWCDVVLEWRPQSFNIGTSKGKAVDATQRMIEEDFGVTDMNDRLREGDVAYKAPAKSKELIEAEARMADAVRQEVSKIETTDPKVQEAVKGFFGGGGVSSVVDVPASMAASRVGPGAYTPERNPIAQLHRAGKAGLLPNNIRVVGKA